MAKVKTIEVEKEFKPISINIVFETQEELDLFGSLFNNFPIADVFGYPHTNMLPYKIWSLVEKLGGDINLAYKFRASYKEDFER